MAGTVRVDDGGESRRIQYVIERDGVEAAITWVRQALDTYRDALRHPHHFARTAHYQPLFERSVEEFQAWLDERSPGHDDRCGERAPTTPEARI